MHMQVKRRTIRDKVLDRAEKDESEQTKKDEQNVVPSVARSKHFQRKLQKRVNFSDSKSAACTKKNSQ